MSQITHTPLDLSNAASVLFAQISEQLESLMCEYSGETAPADPVIGKTWYQPSTETGFQWTGTVWKTRYVLA
jgi:hypothetical protein